MDSFWIHFGFKRMQSQNTGGLSSLATWYRMSCWSVQGPRCQGCAEYDTAAQYLGVGRGAPIGLADKFEASALHRHKQMWHLRDSRVQSTAMFLSDSP